MPDTVSGEYLISEDHPSLAGHFPGNPIIPGVILLDYIRVLFQQWRPGKRIRAISQAKFHQPLRPNQVFMITLQERNPHAYKFACYRKNELISSGLFSTENDA